MVKSMVIFVAGFTVAACVGYVASSGKPVSYEAGATLAFELPSSDSANMAKLRASRRLALTYAAAATGRPTLERVISNLGWNESATRIADRVSVRSELGGTFIEVTARDSDPERAALLANELANEVGSALPGRAAHSALRSEAQTLLTLTDAQIRRLQRHLSSLTRPSARTPADDGRVSALRRGIGNLLTARSRLEAIAYVTSERLPIALIAPAVTPTDPMSPNLTGDALLAGLLGVLVVTPLALYPHFLYDRFLDAEELGEELGVSILGIVPKLDHQWSMAGPRAGSSHDRSGPGYRSPRSDATLRLALALGRRQQSAVVFTGPDESPESSALAVDVGISLARSGKRVLLLDADMKSPRLDSMLGVPNAEGLSTLLVDRGRQPATVVGATVEDRLSILSAGPRPPDPAAIVDANRVRAIIDRLRSAWEVIIINSPRRWDSGEATLVAGAADTAVLVLDLDHVTRTEARSALSRLASTGVDVLGVVLLSRRGPVTSIHGHQQPAAGREVGPRTPTASATNGAADA